MAGDNGETAPRRRRIWKVLAGVLVLFVLLFLLAPVIAQPIVKARVESAIEKQLAVDATIDDLDLSLSGSVTVTGLRLVDERGRDVLHLERAHAELALFRALAGAYDFGAVAEGLLVHVYEESDGTWSAEKLPRDREPREEDDEPREPSSYDVRGLVELKDAQVVLVRRDGANVSVSLECSATFDGPDAPARLGAAVEVLASNAAPGRMVASAELPGDPGAWGDLRRLTAHAALDVERPIDLAPLVQAFGAALPLEMQSGVLGGKGEVRLAPGLDVGATAGLTLDGVELRGPRAEAAPLKLARVRLDVTSEETSGDALAPRIVLRADDAFEMVVASTLHGAGTPDARLAGTLELDGDVTALARLAEGWVVFHEGLTIEGALVGAGAFEIALASGALASASGDFELGIEGLAARDRTQGPIDLGELDDPSFAVEARYDAAAGALDLPSFALAVGPVRAQGATALRGLGAETLTLGATKVDVTADLDALIDALAGIVVLGDTTLGGTLTARLEAEERDGDLPLRAHLEGRGLRAGGLRDRTAAVAAPADVGDVTASLRGTWRRAANELVLDELTLICSGLEARGSGRLEAPDRLPEIVGVTVDLAVDADPSSLPAWVHDALGERRLAGADCALRARGSWSGDTADATVDLTGRDVALVVPDGLELHAGSLRVALRVQGPADALRVSGDGEALALVFQAAPKPAAPGEPPPPAVELNEPRLVFALESTLGVANGDVDLQRWHLESQALSGDVSGRITGLRSADGEIVVDALQGDLVYVPDMLAAALGPLMPGELSGATPEHCRFRLDGRARELTPAALLEGLTGTIDVGVGRFRHTGLELDGAAHLELRDGEAGLTADLKANGGEMTLAGGMQVTPRDGGFVLRDPALAMDADDVRANTGLGPLLGFVHPAFAGLESLDRTEIGGLITCDVNLRYDGELDTRTLAEGWDALPKEPIQGSITFAIDAASLAGSPLIQDLLGKLGLGAPKDLALQPITLDVTDGRLHYAQPWEWTVSGARTTFGGSIGLDKTLDLVWAIPITDEIAARSATLGALRGQTIQVPLGGTITRPKLELDEALKGLTKDLLKGAAEEALRGGIKDVLERKLGKSDDEKPGDEKPGDEKPGDEEPGGERGADDPAALLKRADELWKAGEKAAAAALYRDIREKHKVSIVYALNRDRIKDRGDWKP